MQSEKFTLAGRTALVTGGARRIGRALALALARAGMHVIVHYRESQKDAEHTAEEIAALGVNARTLRADLSQPGEAERLIDHAGEVDVLVNNASIYPRARLLDFAEEDLFETMRVHAWAPLVLSRAFAAQGRPGRILNLLDSRIIDYDALHVPYHLSKRTLFALTRMLAVELAPRITVNAIAPGLVLPPPGETEAYLEKWAHTNFMNAHGALEETTDAALYLLQSGFVTGQVIYVDGGRHMKNAMYGM